MNYWPLSMIAHSPECQHPGFLHELTNVYATRYLSPAAFETCGYIARRTTPLKIDNMVIIESVGASARRVYTGYPQWEEWLQLERGGMIEASDGTLHVLIDALH